MRLIERDELKQKMDAREDFKLVCALSRWAYDAAHIPGSIQVEDMEMASALLRKHDHVVVYCTNVSCVLSVRLYHLLVKDGYRNVRRYAGGLEDWEEAGYPMSGEMPSA